MTPAQEFLLDVLVAYLADPTRPAERKEFFIRNMSDADFKELPSIHPAMSADLRERKGAN